MSPPHGRRRRASRGVGDGHTAGSFPGGADALRRRLPDTQADPESAAREICLRLLATAPRTRAQLGDALRRRDIPDEVADAVLGRFTDVGLIDDDAFARAWVQSRHVGRGLARRALAAELRMRGVAEETVDDAVETLQPEHEEAAARELVARRLAATRDLDAPRRTRRLVGVLARKGYSPELSYRIVREALEGEGHDVDQLPEPPAEL
jgi:regulatory protein